MSAELESVKKFTEAWNSRDLEAMLALAHPEFEYVNPPMAMEPGVRRGHDGLALVARAQWENLGETARMEIAQSHAIGDEHVTEQLLTRSLSEGSPLLETRAVIRWSFRDGLILRLDVLGAGSSFNDGLAAAGIAER